MSTLRKDLEYLADLKRPQKPEPEHRGDEGLLWLIFLLAILALIQEYGCR
jgi:hypothetical protein